MQASGNVTALTRDFELTDEVIDKLVQEIEFFDDDEELVCDEERAKAEIRKRMPDTIDKLCQGDGYFWEDNFPFGTWELLNAIDDIVISSMDSGPDETKLVNILSDNNRDKIIPKIKKVLQNED